MKKNFIYRHEHDISSAGEFEEDFYISNKNPSSGASASSANALLSLQFFLESRWNEYRGAKQAGESCAFIGLVHSGSQKRVTQEGECVIRSGDLIIERQSRKVFYTQALPGEILHRTGVIIYRNAFFELLASALFPEKNMVIHCSDPAKMDICFQAIKEEIITHDGRNDILSQLLFALLQEAYSQKKKREIPEKLSKALDYIEQANFQGISRETVAENAGVSVRLLTELFRKHLGKSPGRYLCERRIRYAVELIASGRLTVGDVAHLAGFGSTEYFIREFRRYTGTTPGKYKK